jgi:hypothetical protein
LREKEKKKLAREKAKDSDTGFEITGEEIIQTLLDADKVLIPIAVSPYGRWGHMFHAFFFGLPPDHKPLKFVNRRSHAFRMYNRALSDPTPLNLIARATSCWKSSEPTTPFYGHSYTAPTPREFAIQKIGLVISTALAMHLRDAKQGNLKPAELPRQPHPLPARTPVPAPPPGFEHVTLCPPLPLIDCHTINNSDL